MKHPHSVPTPQSIIHALRLLNTLIIIKAVTVQLLTKMNPRCWKAKKPWDERVSLKHETDFKKVVVWLSWRIRAGCTNLVTAANDRFELRDAFIINSFIVGLQLTVFLSLSMNLLIIFWINRSISVRKCWQMSIRARDDVLTFLVLSTT